MANKPDLSAYTPLGSVSYPVRASVPHVARADQAAMASTITSLPVITLGPRGTVILSQAGANPRALGPLFVCRRA